MIFRRSKKWSDWRHHIATRCDVLTRGLTSPIPLREIFPRCHVKKVVFQPLLLEAGLAVDDDGFVIFVNCDENSKEPYRLAFENTDQKGQYLPARIRFSLAHELIHTFFYDTKQRPYANRLDGTHPKEIDSLESACNFGASHLLLPTRLLKADTYKWNSLTADGIIQLSEKYQVSSECLINRLERLDDWTPKRGLVAFVRQDSDGHWIKAVAKSVAVRELFKNVCVGADFETAFGRVPLETITKQGSGTLSFDLTYSRQTDFSIANCLIEYRRISRTSQSFVLTLNVGEPSQAIIKHKYSLDADQHIAKLRETIKKRDEPSRRVQHFK